MTVSQQEASQQHITTGFIGLGSQGGPMARQMVEAGYPLLLWARRPEALEPFGDTAAVMAASIAELGERADHVGICVTDDDGVRQICAELLPAMRPGSRVAIHATVHPDTCVELARQAKARGVALIDAPVSGGGGGAAARTLTVMVGGEAAAVAAARPVFETFAGTILHLGDVGAGQLAKLVNNTLMAANMALALEALAAGGALGIERQALIDLIKVSSGRSFAFDVAARLPEPAAFAHGGKLLAKDVRLLHETLGNHPAVDALERVASPFLAQTQQG
jgi:3-hydroxyisobutyrate dehydrogenase